PKTRVGDVGTGRPFPNVAEHLTQPGFVVVLYRSAVGAGMERVAIGKIARHRHALRGDLPLRLARQPLPRPFGERVGFKKTDVADGLDRVQSGAAGQRKDRPLAVFPGPIVRRLPALLAHRRPAVRKPEFRPFVAAGLDEVEIFATASRPRSEAERLEPHLVPGHLVVEGESRPAMPDLHKPARELDP